MPLEIEIQFRYNKKNVKYCIKNIGRKPYQYDDIDLVNMSIHTLF